MMSDLGMKVAAKQLVQETEYVLRQRDEELAFEAEFMAKEVELYLLKF